jgi:hypothetical protein
MLRQFQRRAHHYVGNLPGYESKLDWLALMQHYGAPTRLLDFSHSFYVAAHFALERAGGDSAIWAINLSALQDIIARYSNAVTSHENLDMTNQRHIELVNQHINDDTAGSKPSSPLIVHVEPDRLHERLLLQQGLFLCPCDISKTFVEVLSAAANLFPSAMNQRGILSNNNVSDINPNNKLILKLIIPKVERAAAIRDLFNMNISSATLFPGLDGFARSMHYHFSGYPI